MYLYLPIAEISVNVLVFIGLGAGIGVLSSVFGVGGGFLMTPLLVILGVKPAVAVATGANLILASPVSGVFAHWKRGNVDVKMGVILIIGGLVGSTVGVQIFTLLKAIGQVDLVIMLCYVVFLGAIGLLMLVESIRAMRRRAENRLRKLHQHTWLHGLPFKMRFRRSKLYISALLPLVVGFAVGVLSAIMGVGGGFIMVPAMIYLLGMPTSVMIGTSLLQISFVTANATFFHAQMSQSVDIVLALVLLVGAVVGAQYGAGIGAKMRGEQLRAMLALIVLGVCGKIVFDLAVTPDNLFVMDSAVILR
ncbi:MAG: sulfite exporter TauE/SafE family protein [Proteobacteria bacterium]|nr:sulfite exporter TauE/SafE family protein [Pseudomonadota bacterium]